MTLANDDDVPFFDENDPKLEEVKKLVIWNNLSKQQQWVIYMIVIERKSRRAIFSVWEATFHVPLSWNAVRTCIIRSSLSLHWQQSVLKNGTTEYLIREDMETLKQEIRERAEVHNALDTISILDEAKNLKISRQNKAIEFLRLVHSDGLADKLSEELIEKPKRSWINGILEIIDAKLTTAKIIDSKRFLACSFETLNAYFEKFGSFIRSFNKLLIFNTDETMMTCTKNVKSIVPSSMPTYLATKPPEMPHITAMCCTNVIGSKPPLMIILKEKRTKPKELLDLINSGKVWVCSTPSGWMDRYTFLLWCINFVSWLLEYKAKLPTNIKTLPTLLILDGHTSRENPLALEYLSLYSVYVLVLPGHCTHVLQLFDAGLAAPLKERFTIIFTRNLKDKRSYTENTMSANMRKIAVESFVEAWDNICNKPNCEAAAKISGTFPVDKNGPISSGMVIDLTPQEKARQDEIDRRKANRLDINSSIITNPEKIAEIRQTVARNRDDEPLAKQISSFESADAFFEFVFNEAANHNARMLSVPPPCQGYSFERYFET